MQKMSKIKKNKKSSRCTIKEEDNVYIKECDENETDTKDEDVIKNIENIEETKNDAEDDDDDDEDDEDEEDEEDDEDDEDDDEDDEDDDEDDEDDEEDEEEYAGEQGLTADDLYNVFNNFFTDEYGVSIATSLSNIAFELNKLNKNPKSKK